MSDEILPAAAPATPSPTAERLTIREFRADDIDGLFFLEQQCYPRPLAMSYPQLRALLKEPGIATLVIVGEDGHRPRMVGALTVRPEREQERLVVVSLMVEPEYRRLGLGRRLAERARRAARALGLAAVAVPLEAGNETGAAFLQALGFSPAEHGAPFFATPEEGRVWCLNAAGLGAP
jgi:ribosomal protein S18 acetylase RimI-like enzyme